MILVFNAVCEDKPGEKWKSLFDKTWPYYKQWFLAGGALARKGYQTSVANLKTYMPELLPVYEQLTQLAGGGDLQARFLSMYCPPAYMTGCSQMAITLDDTILVRNYDYSPTAFEGVLFKSNWLKPVMGISDSNWGLLDGINADGLAASLAFGGSSATGEGFGIPLLLRYVLETTSRVDEALEKLYTIPVHMAYNVTLADAEGNTATVYLAPGKEPYLAPVPCATNHQQVIEWPEYAKLTGTEIRKNVLENLLHNPATTEENLLHSFSVPPLFNYNYVKNFGTLYTSLYKTGAKSLKIYLPENNMLEQSFENFTERNLSLHLPDAHVLA